MKFKNILFIVFFNYTILFMKCFANETIIQILIEEPNIENNFDCKNYSIQHENYFLELYGKDPELNNIHLNFICFKNGTNIEESYHDFITNQIKISAYDMIIVDEKYLFSDIAFIKSSFINNHYNKKDFLENYVKTNITDNDDFSYHNREALKNGCLNNYIIGFPYEQDFNLIYYNNKNVNLANKNNITWDDLLLTVNHSNKTNQNPINIALNNDDDLLDTLIEYTTNKYDTIINDDNFGTFFYNEKSHDLFNSFQSFIINSSLLNNNNNKTLEKSQKNMYNSFVNNEAFLLKGKASYYKYLVHNHRNKSFSALLPPKNMSVTNTKYLIINKNSNYSKTLLKKIALKLTSEKMQIFRAENFGNIPTFDISKKEQNASIKLYCQTNPELCEMIENIKIINIKNVFKGKYSPPFIEIRLLLPQVIRNFFTSSNYDYISNIFENIKTLVIDNSHRKKTLMISLYVTQTITIIGSLIPLILLFVYKKHLYLKSYSPMLCSFIVIGLILCTFDPFLAIYTKSTFICQIKYINDIIMSNLIMIPMIMITFRIYSIYNNKSKVNFGKKLNNKRLLKLLIILLLFMISLGAIYLYQFEFYIESYGNITTFRHPKCKFKDGNLYEYLDRIIYRIMVNIYLFIYTYIFLFVIVGLHIYYNINNYKKC